MAAVSATPRLSGQARGDQAFSLLLRICALIAVAVLAAIVLLLALNSGPTFQKFGFNFLTGTLWDPAPPETLGVLPFIYGTIVTSVIALVLALPLAIGAALFVSEYAPRWLGTPVAFVIELLVTIPSVVYGLWGVTVLVPFMRQVVVPLFKNTLGFIPLIGPTFFPRDAATDGSNLLSGGFILAIMITPTILSISREVIAQVPRLQKEGMLAMGATKWEAIRLAILPYAQGGIVGAALLGFARAFGETMAILMIAGNGPTNANGITTSLFAGGSTIASKIAGGATEASSPLGFSAVIELGLVLLLVASIFNIIARQYVNRIKTLPGG